MGVVQRFEDLRVWKDAEILVGNIYQITGSGPFSRDFSLKDQIRRAAVSIMSNIAEGFERGSNREFIQFLQIAKGSAGELRSQLYVAQGQRYLTPQEFDSARGAAESLSRQIAAFITYLRTRADEKRQSLSAPR